jgi:transposase-like protein
VSGAVRVRAAPVVIVRVAPDADGARGAQVSVTGVGRRGQWEPLTRVHGDPDDPALWRGLFSELYRAGLRGVSVVASPDHPGLASAVFEFFPTASWRCRADATATGGQGHP